MSEREGRSNKNKVEAKRRPKSLPPQKRNKKGKPNQQKKVEKKEYKKQTEKAVKLRPIRPANMVMAPGVRPDIMVYADVDETAVQGAHIGVLCRALTQGWFDTNTNPLYYASVAFLLDLKAIMSQQVTPVSGRLGYLNKILASLYPKSVRGLKGSTINYTWTGVENVNANITEYSIRQYKTYLWERTNATVGIWYIQQQPSTNPTTEEACSTLSKLYSLLGRDDIDRDHAYVNSVEFHPEYLKDVSAFASVSPYYGQSSGVASASFSSVESEIPFKSEILSSFTALTSNPSRVGRFLKCSSGGSMEALSVGCIPEFESRFYKTPCPIIYKYIDLDEIVWTLQSWYVALVQQAIKSLNGALPSGTDEIAFALTPLSITADVFRICIRQCVLSKFTDQSVVQTNTYTMAKGGFEPLRVGTNCYAPNLETNIMIPALINENINGLSKSFFHIEDKKFNTPHNVFLQMPVIGVYKNADIPNIKGNFLVGESYGFLPICQPTDFSGPNVIDGTDSGSNVCDFVKSDVVTTFIADWNARVNILKQFSLPCTQLGGGSNASLLSFTRYCQYSSIQKLESELMPYERHIAAPFIQEVEKRHVVRTNSRTGEVVTFDRMYIPPNGSLQNQHTTAYSSVSEIKLGYKQILQYLILPTIVDEGPNFVPYQRQYRVAAVEPYVLDIAATLTSIAGRGSTLKNLGTLCAPGPAASGSDELNNVVKFLTERGKGGFIGDVLSMLAKDIPI